MPSGPRQEQTLEKWVGIECHHMTLAKSPLLPVRVCTWDVILEPVACEFLCFHCLLQELSEFTRAADNGQNLSIVWEQWHIIFQTAACCVEHHKP